MENKGKIVLIGFNLEPTEIDRVNKIIEHYSSKLERNCGFESLKIELRKSQHGKTFLHEINANAFTRKALLASKTSGYNLYNVLSEALQKILNESEHKDKKC